MATSETTRILKANDIRGVGSKVVFNFEDIKGRCEEHLTQVRAQAAKVLADAMAEAESLRKTSFEIARKEGFSAGMQDAEKRISAEAKKLAQRIADEQMSTVLPTLRQATDALNQERDCCLERWETTALGLAVAIAEKLLRRHLNAHPDAARGMIRGALELAAGTPQLRLRLHPEDIELFGDDARESIRVAVGSDDAALVPDATISRGGCVVETTHGTIDARLETMIERISDELLQ